MSRHRDQCQVFTPLSKLEDALDRVGIELSEEEKIEDNVQTTLERLGKALEKSHQKTTSLDHITHDEAKKKLMDVDKEAAIKATNEQEVEM
jgi:hypothetical protein